MRRQWSTEVTQEPDRWGHNSAMRQRYSAALDFVDRTRSVLSPELPLKDGQEAVVEKSWPDQWHLDLCQRERSVSVPVATATSERRAHKRIRLSAPCFWLGKTSDGPLEP